MHKPLTLETEKGETTNARMSCAVLLQMLLLLLLAARAQQQQVMQARTDPKEVAALDAILGRWGKTTSPLWKMADEPCYGIAVDDTDLDSNPKNNPGIKCNCSYINSTVCHITKLRVYALNVAGHIPTELQYLTHLTYLNLDQNYLTGYSPAFIGDLTELKELHLGFNALEGVLPRELWNLKNLNLLGNSMTKFVGALPEEIKYLTELQELYIDSCGLSGELPSTLSKLKNLIVLRASDNDFTGKIPDYIGSLSNLEDLELHGNKFEGPIPASLSKLVKLTNLSLRNCRISDKLASMDFSNFKGLTYLDLSFNNITGILPSIIMNLPALNFLFLGSNNLSGSLPDTTISPSLSTIDLSYNMLSGRFPSWVSTKNLNVNLVWNNFMIDSSNSSILPSGLECLQRATPCSLGQPDYSSFAVDCGGSRFIKSQDKFIYEPDNATLQGASYYVTSPARWGVSQTGIFLNSPNPSYTIYSSRQFSNTLDGELFQTARMTPSSLRYYGIRLKNGVYNVVLQFAEILSVETRFRQ